MVPKSLRDCNGIFSVGDVITSIDDGEMVQVQTRSEGVPLVLARVTTCSFTLRATTPDSGVGTTVEDLPGVSEEPGDSIHAWEQVEHPFIRLE